MAKILRINEQYNVYIDDPIATEDLERHRHHMKAYQKQLKYTRPLHQAGDILEVSFSSGTFQYQVRAIVVHPAGLYYDLVGHKIISRFNAEEQLYDFNSYHPFCMDFDKKAIKCNIST